MKPTTTTSTTSLPDVDLLKKGDKSTQNQRAEEERTTEDFVWPTDNVVHILSSRNGKLTGDSRKMEYIKNKNGKESISHSHHDNKDFLCDDNKQ